MSDSQKTPSEVPVIYVNAVRVAVSFTDVRLFLGENFPIAFGEEAKPHVVQGQHIVDRICAVVSPELLPQLIEGLSKGLQNYQSNFGPLRPLPQAPITAHAETKKG